MDKHINLIKLCVGAETVQDLRDWQGSPRAKGPDGRPRHITRMWPKRAEELCAGGSIFWVFKGMILCRQPILRLDPVQGADGVSRCALVLGADVTLVAPTPKRPFQGWRYLTPADAPPDLSPTAEGDTPLPSDLARELADIGIL